MRKIVEVFRHVRRCLNDDGVLWLNLGDSYNGSGPSGGNGKQYTNLGSQDTTKKKVAGLKSKDLVGIPWRVAFALQSDGWYLRSDIIWSKPNPMPESVDDRPTKAHEYIFLLSKSQQYFYDAEAIKERMKDSSYARLSQDIENQTGSNRVPGKTNGTMKAVGKQAGHGRRYDGFNGRWNEMRNQPGGDLLYGMANKRSVWEIPTIGFKEAHFATFPENIPSICIKAGSRSGDIILDPFMGSGTVGVVAKRLKRKYIGIELNPKYIEMAEKRIKNEHEPLLVEQ